MRIIGELARGALELVVISAFVIMVMTWVSAEPVQHTCSVNGVETTFTYCTR